ncbi:hypothetical protein PtA15_11A218 [Puccinia triticina]|uniref:Uncharacterized protein n=1 Tax=Puccinia triticina TaxID=208348 RepID=A0ABY7CW63_9BASI|nr:uncharacterized protein PtA15_11A215 [Puccinia triticina]XP_053025084.1 uncharacterized protein PtA15_11A218 [Puccinia triticina]WAQ89526.1 hypothetical protein PtA15_11A215 [Puccinia triticina]WAQ89529.1 hypothetical protein PtA15_11A218 [Puccinia triticina]
MPPQFRTRSPILEDEDGMTIRAGHRCTINTSLDIYIPNSTGQGPWWTRVFLPHAVTLDVVAKETQFEDFVADVAAACDKISPGAGAVLMDSFNTMGRVGQLVFWNAIIPGCEDMDFDDDFQLSYWGNFDDWLTSAITVGTRSLELKIQMLQPYDPYSRQMSNPFWRRVELRDPSWSMVEARERRTNLT